MSKKYSEYTNVGSLTDNTVFPVESDAGLTRYSLWSLIKSTLKTYFDTLYAPINPYPVGSFYVQYPDADSNTLATAFPTSKSPATLFGGTWAEQWGSEGVFFRTLGDPYSEGQDHQRTNGKQTDQFEDHLHSSSAPPYGYVGAGQTGSSDANWNIKTGTNQATGASLTDGVNTLRSGKETRSLNRLIKVWKRTA